MNNTEKEKIIELYNSYSDDVFLDALLLAPEDYQDGVYEVMLGLCKQRGLETALDARRKPKEPPSIEELLKEKLVTVARFSYLSEAHLVKTRIESEGIECYLQDENMVNLGWHYSNLMGGLRLQVKSSDVEDVKLILSDLRP